MKKIRLYFLTAFFSFTLLGTSSYAQLGGPPTDTLPEPGDNDFPGDDVQDEIVPINGLVFVGLAVGAIYGIRKKYVN